MPEFDWMTDPSFQRDIQQQSAQSAGRYGMAYYQTAIAEWIVARIRENSAQRISAEMQKQAAERRGRTQALESVDLLLKFASETAKRAGRDTVTMEDVSAAFRAHFCKFWPIC